MASKEQIFGVLAGASGPMSRVELEDKVGEKYQRFQSQLDRWVKQEFLKDTGDHHYILTDTGREEALRKGEFKDIDEEPGLQEEREGTQESLATTEYQQFLRLGKRVGVVPNSLIKVTADHVWTGDFRDMEWVAQALMEMGIRQDERNRWFNGWRGLMKQPRPAHMPPEFSSSETKKSEEKKEGAGKRDYILSEGDNPTYAGDGLGDLDYKDALELSKIRATRGKSDGRPPTAGSMAEDVAKIFSAFKEVMGDRAVGKSYIVKPGPDGAGLVEEIEPGKPLLIPQPGGARPSPSYLVDNDGSVKELQPGQPVVIVKEAPKPIVTSGTHYLIDQRTGEVKEVAPGQPVVIIRESAPALSQSTPIQVTDKDGRPMVLDLSTFIKLEEHKEKQRQNEESHQVKMDIAKTFKDMLHKAGTALSHMVEEEEGKKEG